MRVVIVQPGSWRNLCPVMILWVILLVLVLLAGWLLIAPFSIEADTRKPYFLFRWVSIGRAELLYRDDLLLHLHIFFFHKTIHLLDLRPAKKKKPEKKKTGGRKMTFSRVRRKAIRVLRSFTVKKFELALDTGDAVLNARLFPVNYLPYCRNHVAINFRGENYLCFHITNRPWKLARAFLK